MNPKATPFTTVLVANRGEIALRVMRSAKAAGYRTVAVYSTADALSPHVSAADLAVCIGEAAPAASYLNIQALVQAAKQTGADSVHPGYGFLAENAAFAQACVDAGLVFIGPSPQAIAAMGDKAQAKRLMQAAGVPCIPGDLGEDQSPSALAQAALRVGYPVMIKAVAGGGGRGMRLVHEPGEFAAALKSAQSEAANAFGDGRVLLERAVLQPRHIEIQVLGDRYGQVVHLGERDCSVQRRHQKLIEEAPSPAVSPSLRERMGEAAIAACKAIAYEGAGTLEFLLSPTGEFFFMEMNTRLQVEHPVTEAITGLDLVALQLKLAAGEALPFSQSEVRFEGHAIEVRLCAEDAARNFMPQSGSLALWQAPQGVRVEHALQSGQEIPPNYDSMMAKLIAHGATREEARRKLVAALRELVALGLPTNQVFLQACLEQAAFVAGAATTAFIAQHEAALLRQPSQGPSKTPLYGAALAAALMVQLGRRNNAGAGAVLQVRPHASLGPRSVPSIVHLELDSEPYTAELQERGSHPAAAQLWEVQVKAGKATTQTNTIAVHLELSAWQHTLVQASLGGVRSPLRFALRPQANGESILFFQWQGQAHKAVNTTYRPAQKAVGHDAGHALLASTAGKVVAIAAQVGEAVLAGQGLITLEAMKMEHAQAAPRGGRVRELLVQVGQQVASGQLLLSLEREAAGDNASPKPDLAQRP